MFFALFASLLMWGTTSHASPQSDVIHLQCLQIEGNPENMSYACDQMRTALMDRFADKTVSIVPSNQNTPITQSNLVRFVFSEGKNQILYGRLETPTNSPDTSTPTWQVETRILDTPHTRVGYRTLVRALLTVNPLDHF